MGNTPRPSFPFVRVLPAFVATGCHAAAVSIMLTATVTQLLGSFGRFQASAVAGVLVLFALPTFLFGPLYASFGRGVTARWTRLGCAVGLVGVAGWVLGMPVPLWLSATGVAVFAFAVWLVAAGAQQYSVAKACRVPPVRFASLQTLLILVGALLGFRLAVGGNANAVDSAPWAFAFALVGLLAEMLARYPNLAVPAEGNLWRTFWVGARDMLGHRHARNCLIGLWLWFFTAATLVVAVVRLQIDDAGELLWHIDAVRPPGDAMAIHSLWAAGLAALVGVLLAAIGRNSFRVVFVVPYAATGAFACVLWWSIGDAWYTPLVGLGFCMGLAFAPLLHYVLIWTTPRHHAAVLGGVVMGWAVGGGVLAALLSLNDGHLPALRSMLYWVLAGVTGFAAVASWLVLLRPVIEGTIEVLLLPVYRIRAYGAVLPDLPDRGPCMVIANHAAWWDPLFLAKILPAPTTPMMTSKFYDLPVISWLMRRVMMTIRVPDVAYRHEAPELNEAVAAINRGDCLVLFPEGYLRRKEEVPLRRFGRGVWHILSRRPATPVYACWIEGNWGSYFSHRLGPPTKNKPIDFWHRVQIGVVGPIVLDAVTLSDHMATRLFLMQQVSLARTQLGLPPLEFGQLEGEAE